MKLIIPIFSLCFLFGSALQGQEVTYDLERLPAVVKSATVNFSELGPDFAPHFDYLEAPTPGGALYREFLAGQKAKGNLLYPRQNSNSAQHRNLADPPQLLTEFAGNNSTQRTPMDNHMAISNDGQIVSVINSHIAIKDEAGDWLGAATLASFTSPLGNGENKFDPRILYDPEADRFIMFMLAGFTSSTNSILLAFSATNDATGDWYLYEITGNPLNDNTWSDYPIVAMSKSEVFLTLNLLENGGSWQEGFVQTIVWQMDKMSGYNGDNLQSQLYSNITFNGDTVRYLCPVRYATEDTQDKMYFLSDINFAVESDSFWIAELAGTLNDPGIELEIELYFSDTPYGAPPNAIQETDELATNDARILDAMYLPDSDQIQFVTNTRDFSTGQAAIYHGVIDQVSTDPLVTGYIINGGQDDLGYPSIAYAGMFPGDEDAIIVVSHVSEERFPGCSALYFDNDRQHSDLVTIKEGNDFILMQPNSDVERWGDYSGAQRKYNEPGIVWGACSFGESNNDNDTWIGKLGRPDLPSFTQTLDQPSADITTYPNPAVDRVNVRYTLQEAAQLRIWLVDQQGQIVQTFFDGEPVQQGEQIFSFTTGPLASGQYYLSVEADGKLLSTEKILIQR
jgi:hypothetical protein